MENRFIRAEDVAQELNVSKPYRYSNRLLLKRVRIQKNQFVSME